MGLFFCCSQNCLAWHPRVLIGDGRILLGISSRRCRLAELLLRRDWHAARADVKARIVEEFPIVVVVFAIQFFDGLLGARAGDTHNRSSAEGAAGEPAGTAPRWLSWG